MKRIAILFLILGFSSIVSSLKQIKKITGIKRSLGKSKKQSDESFEGGETIGPGAIVPYETYGEEEGAPKKRSKYKKDQVGPGAIVPYETYGEGEEAPKKRTKNKKDHVRSGAIVPYKSLGVEDKKSFKRKSKKAPQKKKKSNVDVWLGTMSPPENTERELYERALPAPDMNEYERSQFERALPAPNMNEYERAQFERALPAPEYNGNSNERTNFERALPEPNMNEYERAQFERALPAPEYSGNSYERTNFERALPAPERNEYGNGHFENAYVPQQENYGYGNGQFNGGNNQYNQGQSYNQAVDTYHGEKSKEQYRYDAYMNPFSELGLLDKMKALVNDNFDIRSSEHDAENYYIQNYYQNQNPQHTGYAY